MSQSLLTMLARLLFAIAEELEPGAVHKQVQLPGSVAIGNPHNCMAVSEDTAGPPGRPSSGAHPVICVSTQIGSIPRLRSDALPLDQFVLRSRAEGGFLVQAGETHGFRK